MMIKNTNRGKVAWPVSFSCTGEPPVSTTLEPFSESKIKEEEKRKEKCEGEMGLVTYAVNQ